MANLLLLFSSLYVVNALLTDLEPCDELDKLIPDPKNCSRFYECTLNGWVGLPCYPGLYFNPSSNQCDYPENVDCSASLREPEGNCEGLELDQLKPHPENCSRFIQCAPQGLIVLTCPETLLFNPETLLCDYSGNVLCPDGFEALDVSEDDCGDLPLDQLKPDPSDCSKFYQCAPQGLVLLSCPEGTLFNSETLLCDSPENVQCANTSAPLNLTEDDCGDLELDQLTPDPLDCSKFIQCAPQGLVVLPCPNGLHFNPQTLVCDYPENVQCNATLSNNSSTNDCGSLSVGDLEPDPSNCSQFLQCAPSGLIALPCSSGLFFNPQTLQCDYPSNVQCANETRLHDFSAEPCDAADIDKVYPNSLDCTKFWQCSSFGFVSFTCPEGLHFNTATSQCDYPENADCESEINV